MNLAERLEDLANYRCEDLNGDDEFNQRLSEIQDMLGQEDGGFAGMFFTEYDRDWAWMTYEHKLRILREYVSNELDYVTDEDREDVTEEVCSTCEGYVNGESDYVHLGYKRFCQTCDKDLHSNEVNLKCDGEIVQRGI